MYLTISYLQLIATIVFCAFLGLMCPDVYAQGTSVQFPDNKEIWFDGITGKVNSGLINGKRNNDYYFQAIGHQYFMSSDWFNGDITYLGEDYKDVLMKFDVNSEIIVIKHINRKQEAVLLELNKMGISKFNVEGHYFKKLKIRDKGSGLRTGFYEIMYEGGKLDLICKRFKTKRENYENSIVREEFEANDRYYLQQGNKYKKIRKAKDFLKIFKPYKKKIKRFLKDNNIRRYHSDDQVLILLTTYCNKLSNPRL